MNKPRIIIASCLLLALACGTLAQQYDCNCTEPESIREDKAQNMLIFREYQNPIRNYGGSQFYNPWAEGYIILENDERVHDMLLRYDMFTDELIWLRDGDYVQGIVNKPSVKAFVMEVDSSLYFVKKNIRPPGLNTTAAYLQVLTEGQLDLMVYRNVVKAVSESKTVANTMYYIFTDDRNYNSVRLRKGSLLSFPGIDKALMKNIIRSNRLNLKIEQNFIKAVYLYNHSGS
jgi:hypothetical protein